MSTPQNMARLHISSTSQQPTLYVYANNVPMQFYWCSTKIQSPGRNIGSLGFFIQSLVLEKLAAVAVETPKGGKRVKLSQNLPTLLLSLSIILHILAVCNFYFLCICHFLCCVVCCRVLYSFLLEESG